MEVTAAVLYGGSLAHYDVEVRDDRECIAQLSSYNGKASEKPPQQIKIKKEGRHWVSADASGALPDDLGYAVELKMKPLIEERKRLGGNPAE
jgi:hypothetical protein